MRRIELALPVKGGRASAVGYLHDVEETMPRHQTRPCVAICPGGGYGYCSPREADPPALALFAAGYQVFILDYSVEDMAAEMRPLMELSTLVMEMRRHQADWQIDPDKIAVMGFSAGGHLAASLGTLWNHDALAREMDTASGQNRPNAMILCYPVITAGMASHGGSIGRVSGGDPDKTALFSLENQVSEQTPPAFIWHTADDPVVPIENALLLCSALRQHVIPFEAHIFEHGAHGLSMCNEEVNTPDAACAPWFSLCVAWLGRRFDFRY